VSRLADRPLRTACIWTHTAVVSDTSLSELASALNDLYRLSGSPRFHEETVKATRVQVSRSGLRFLSLVADEGPISTTRLASALDLSQPTASRTLQQLEADGLVARQASRSDGRVSYYLATTKGRRALERVHAFHVSQLAAALSDVDPGRRADLAGAVTELVRRLRPAPAAAPSVRTA
jgi:DNA-binding MarR family transcriptional regulator